MARDMTARPPTPPPPSDDDAPGATSTAQKAKPSTSRERAARKGGRKGDSRFYVDAHGRRYWSVTTLIGDGLPKPALLYWAANATAEAALDDLEFWATMLDRRGFKSTKRALADARYESSGEKADLGTAVHAAVQRWVLDQPLPDDMNDPTERMVLRFLDHLERHRPTIIAAELVVFNREYGYAGRLDLIAQYPRLAGSPTLLVDVKTGSGVYPDHALQLAAYQHATHAELADGREVDMPAVDGCAVLHLTPDSWELTPVETGQVRENTGAMRDVFRTFLHVREVYRWQRELAMSVVRAPYPVPPVDGDAPTAVELLAGDAPLPDPATPDNPEE